MKTWKPYLIVLATLLIASAAAYAYYQHDFQNSSLTDLSQVRTTVAAFGDELSQVSLLAPAPDVAKAMDKHYAFYIHPDLLAAWKADPVHAPGRLTSSPYPDRIEVGTTTQNANGTYTVDGAIIERVSATPTPVSTIPVRFTLTKGPDGWQITGYQKL